MASSGFSRRTVRSFLPIIGLLALLLLVMAFTVHSLMMNANTVTLPIEVFPKDGRSVHVEPVTVGISDPSGADSMYIQIHAPGYNKNEYTIGDYNDYSTYQLDQKASFRVNGGGWIDIDNQNFVPRWPESTYYTKPGDGDPRGHMEGPIGEYLHTLRGALSLEETGDLTPGENTIEFRFNGTEGITSGYRIIDLEVRAGSANLIDGTTFEDEDFTAWGPPDGFDNSSDISAGQSLFAERNILHDGGAVFGPDQTEDITASCADCHARDGSDLKFYNYSNRSIVARSMFHGLTEEEGKQIAAYVRTRDLPYDDLAGWDENNCGGTPWDPPYQPGPGLDDKPAECWGRGAGVDAWLVDQQDQFEFWQNEMEEGRTDTRSLYGINVREMPTTVLFPDWNNWLPDIHPLDAIDEDPATAEAQFEDWTPKERFDNVFDYLEANEGENLKQTIIDSYKPWTGRNDLLVEFARTGTTQGRIDSDFNIKNRNEAEGEYIVVSDLQWRAVKTWEAHNRWPIQEGIFKNTVEQYYEGEEDLHFLYDRGWQSQVRNLFNVAPHRSNMGDYPNRGVYATARANQAFSNAWYQLQLVVDPSQRGVDGGGAVDWNYQQPHIAHHHDGYSHSQWMDAMKNFTFFGQQRDDALFGTDHRRSYISPFFFHNFQQYQPAQIFRTFGSLLDTPQHIIDETLTEVTRQWLGKMYRAKEIGIPRKDTCEGDFDLGSGQVQREDCVPEADNYNARNMANMTYWYAQAASENDWLPASTQDSLAQWGNEMWPNGDWEQFMIDESERPEVEVSQPTNENPYTAPVNMEIGLNVSDNEHDIERVEFYVDGERIGTRSDGPSRYPWLNVAAGTYEIMAKAITDDGIIGESESSTITVEEGGEPGEAGTQDISLREGWNLISSRFAPDNLRFDAVLDEIINDVIIAKDARGHAFLPGNNIDDIGLWNPFEGYMVYSTNDQMLTIEGQALHPEYTPIPLREGWNHIPYLVSEPMPVEDALDSVLGDIVVVKDYAGQAYLPEYNIDEIGMLQPGQSYKVYASHESELTYPAPEEVSEAVIAAQQADTEPMEGTASSSMLLVHGDILEEGDQVSVRTAASEEIAETTVEEGRAFFSLPGPDPVHENDGLEEGTPLVVDAQRGGSSIPIAVTEQRNLLSGEMERSAEITYEVDGLTEVTVSEQPEEFSLEQSYPNPTRTEATIEFTLAEETSVTLEMYNTLGQRVAVFADETRPPGRHEVTVDASQFSSGTYFYRLRADEYIESKQMVIVR